MTEIRFYRVSGEHGYLSNLFPVMMTFGGMIFTSAEAAYQFGKAKDPATAEWLVSAPKPHLCAITAHALLPYDVRDEWKEVKVQRMKDVALAKFSQHPSLAEQLLGTGDAILIEDSQVDAFWGIGKKGNGQNMLGKILMETREMLRSGPAGIPETDGRNEEDAHP
jgi:hypothetical protein